MPSERTATVAIGHGKQAALGIDAYLAGHDLIDPPRGELATFERPQHLVLRRCATSTPTRARGGPAPEHFRRGRRRPHRRECPVRGSALSVVRQLLRMRQLLRRLPGQRSHQT